MLRALSIALALTAGCALAHDGPVNDDERALIKKAKVLILVDQEKAEASITDSTSGKDFGLIGMTIDLMDTNARAKKMHTALVPVQEATADLNFRRDFVAQLKALKLFDPARIEFVAKRPESMSQLRKLVADAGDPAVVIDASARFSPFSYRSLAVDIVMSLWTGKKRDAVHMHRVSYISEPVTLSLGMTQESISLPVWAENRGRRYRAAYAQGIAGSIDLLVKAFEVTQPVGAKWQSRTDYSDPNFRNPKYGYVIDETSDRVEILNAQEIRSMPILHSYAEIQKDVKPVKANMSRVYFYRPGLSDTYFVDPTFYANGSKMGDVYHRTYFYADVAPGRYSIRVKYDGDQPGAGLARSQLEKTFPVEIDVAAGNEYFVRYNGYKGLFTKDEILKSVDATTAQPELKELMPMRW